jgi:hypothetical protein
MQAIQFCGGLGMAIGTFDSAAQETCVRTAGIDGAIMLGITQLPNQATPSAGWVRIADNMPLQYVNWGSSQPNDGSTPGENNEEQCAYSSSSGTWQDASCQFVSTSRWICRASIRSGRSSVASKFGVTAVQAETNVRGPSSRQ